MDQQLKPILSELRTRLAGLYGDRLVRLVLYGSRARGDTSPDSDIDVLVVLGGAVDSCNEIARTEKIVAEVSLSHDVAVACVFVSEEDFEQRQTPLLLNIRREGVMV